MKKLSKPILQKPVEIVKFRDEGKTFYYLVKRSKKTKKVTISEELVEEVEVERKPAKTPEELGWVGMPKFISHDRSLPSGFKEYLQILLGYANSENMAWPAQETILESMAKSKASLKRYNRILKDKYKVIIFQRGFNRSNLFIFPKWWPLPKKLASKNDARRSPVIAPGGHQRPPEQDNKELYKRERIILEKETGLRRHIKKTQDPETLEALEKLKKDLIKKRII